MYLLHPTLLQPCTGTCRGQLVITPGTLACTMLDVYVPASMMTCIRMLNSFNTEAS